MRRRKVQTCSINTLLSSQGGVLVDAKRTKMSRSGKLPSPRQTRLHWREEHNSVRHVRTDELMHE